VPKYPPPTGGVLWHKLPWGGISAGTNLAQTLQTAACRMLPEPKPRRPRLAAGGMGTLLGIGPRFACILAAVVVWMVWAQGSSAYGLTTDGPRGPGRVEQ